MTASQPESSYRLLLALNDAAASLQRSAHSEAEVLDVFRQQIEKLGLRGGISLLEEQAQNLVIRVFAPVSKLLKKFEELTGLQIEGYKFPLEQVDVYREVVNDGEPIFLAQSNAVLAQLLPASARQFAQIILRALGATPAIYVPLKTSNKVFGVLNVVGMGLTREDLPVVEAFGNQLAIALDNARLFTAMQAEVAERAQVEEALSHLVLNISTTHDFSSLLQKIVACAAQLIKAKGGALYLSDPAQEGLSLQAEAFLESDINQGCSLRMGEEVAKWVMKHRQPVLVGDYRSWGERTIAVDGEQACCAVLSAPLPRQGEITGVLQVMDVSESRQYTSSDMRLLTLFANQAAVTIENARLYEQAATERRHLSLLYEVGRELAASLDSVEILERAITLTCRALDGLVGQAFLYSEADNRLRLYAIYGRSEANPETFNREVILSPGDGLAGWVAKYRQAVYVMDVEQDPRWLHIPMVDENVRSAIVAPILAEERLLGVISVLHIEPAAFPSNQLDLLTAICQEVGLALSNARRYQEVDRRLAEMTLIQNLALTFNQRLEVQELLDEVIAQLVQKLGYPHAEIFLVDGDALIQKSYHGTEPLEQRLPLSEGIVGRVARTGEVALVKDVSLDADFLPGADETVAELAVPIFNGKVVIGVINIESDQAGQLNVQDQELLRLLAGQISIALENAVLYERVRLHADDLELVVAQRTSELVELYKLSQEIGFTLAYDDLLATLLSHLRTAMNCELVMGCLFMDSYNRIAIDTARPLSLGLMEELSATCLKALPEPPTWDSREPFNPVKLIPPNGNGSSRARLNALGSRIIAPMTVAGSIVGLLMAGNERLPGFSKEQNRLLDTFANQAGAAIQRIRSMLAAEHKRMEGLVEHLPTGVLLLDADFRLLVANPLGRDMLAQMNENKASPQVLHLGALSIQELIEHYPNPAPLEITLKAPIPRVYEVQAQAVGDADRQWLITLRDVTQDRETQMRIQMQDRLATVGQLAAGIAHDFNNIMAAILVYTDLLADDPKLPPDSRDRLLVIQQQVQRAASLIRQILDFSRRSIMEQSTLDLLPFVKELDRMLGRVLPETIQVDLSYQPGMYLVNADPTRLQQVFMNLAVNARDAMPDGGRLIFELGSLLIKPQDTRPFRELAEGSWVTIAIKDTGVGISPEHLPHVFEPFFTTKPVGEGTGLGLAQVYGIIKQHGGFIDVKSQVGVGTTFTIYLRALSRQENGQAANRSKEKFDGNGTRVLVVEDDRATLEALRALLESQNYHVLTARHGGEALDLLTEHKTPISLVVSDLVMPQMGGLALYRTIQDRWPGIKMLFVTGHPLEGENQALLEKGEVKWLQKPFSVNEFSQIVKSLLV